VPGRSGGNGDRKLRQAASDREQDEASDRVAEVEIAVEAVCRLGENDARGPRHAGRSNEHDKLNGDHASVAFAA